MNRLTEKYNQGSWGLKGICWEQLYEGQVITGEMCGKLHGALWKLMEYENTGMTPEEVEKLHDEQDKHRWISMEEQLPEDDVLVLVTVSGIYNAMTFVDVIQIGVHDREGWFIEGYEKWDNPNVTAWMPLPAPYRPAPEQNKPSGWQEQMMGAFLGDSRL